MTTTPTPPPISWGFFFLLNHPIETSRLNLRHLTPAFGSWTSYVNQPFSTLGRDDRT